MICEKRSSKLFCILTVMDKNLCKRFAFCRKRRETNNKSVAKNRARKKEEKEAKEKRMEELRKENQEIEQRTAVHQQVSAFDCEVSR